MIVNAQKISKRKVSHDIFYTPVELVRQHIQSIPQEYHTPNNKWLDPFYGTGNYYNNFPHNNKEFTEIELGRDFFDYTDVVDVIVSNPPFSLVYKILEHSITLNPKVISFITSILHLQPIRMKMMNDAGYGITYLRVFRVKGWFAYSLIVVFEKGKKNIIDIDTSIYMGTSPV